jgi:hypothetical protein
MELAGFPFYSSKFILFICHRDHSSDQLHHDWNMSSGKDWHSVGVCSFFVLPEMTITAGIYELERESSGYRTCCLWDFGKSKQVKQCQLTIISSCA